jgi:hypothetical protein
MTKCIALSMFCKFIDGPSNHLCQLISRCNGRGAFTQSFTELRRVVTETCSGK